MSTSKKTDGQGARLWRSSLLGLAFSHTLRPHVLERVYSWCQLSPAGMNVAAEERGGNGVDKVAAKTTKNSFVVSEVDGGGGDSGIRLLARCGVADVTAAV